MPALLHWPVFCLAMAHVPHVVVELRMEAHDTVFWGCRSVPRADLRHLVSFFRELGQCVSSSHTPAAMALVFCCVLLYWP